LSASRLYVDAINQVFYSVGICTGVMFAYGSYNPLRKPVIADSITIVSFDFIFSITTCFIAWGCIGYLDINNNEAYVQSSTLGLSFIAMPTMASLENNLIFFAVYCFYLFICGIDTAFSFVESIVTNIVDALHWARWKAAMLVCMIGLVASSAFTTNFGWVMFDLTEHYMLNYIVPTVGLLQCIAVGWLFEYETTAVISKEHRRSLRIMSVGFWLPTVLICFYANFLFEDDREIGMAIIIFTTTISLGFSFFASKMPFNSWYHEIVLCGVDKLSMSITSLTHDD